MGWILVEFLLTIDGESFDKYDRSSRNRGARKIYLTSIKNSERDIFKIIENFSKDDENSTIKLTLAKVSLQDKINKVKQQDEVILKVLKTEDMENEIKEILLREENLQILRHILSTA